VHVIVVQRLLGYLPSDHKVNAEHVDNGFLHGSGVTREEHPLSLAALEDEGILINIGSLLFENQLDLDSAIGLLHYSCSTT